MCVIPIFVLRSSLRLRSDTCFHSFSNILSMDFPGRNLTLIMGKYIYMFNQCTHDFDDVSSLKDSCPQNSSGSYL